MFEATSAASNAGAGGKRLRIDKPDLFGGERREGGIRGEVVVLMGEPGHGQNDDLAADEQRRARLSRALQPRAAASLSRHQPRLEGGIALLMWAIALRLILAV
ncbi:MAG: hypothetical protein EA339_00165 [Rhodobacteraceae bacterium]|nr:MAG: hypothetical protein EA339_00165 [Paracoccaceae bacterium]